MLVIDLIERGVLHHAAEIDRLHDEYAVGAEQRGDAAHHAVQFLEMEEHAGGGDDFRRSALGQDVARRSPR